MRKSDNRRCRLDDVGKVVRERDAERAEHQHADPCRRAEEHQQRKDELIAADEFQSGQAEEIPILHVALAPAQIPPQEFDERRRILLPAIVLDRHHAHVIAGAPHQHGFDLVVAQHFTAEDRVGRKRRQMAMLEKRRDAEDAVMSPIGPAIALPPGCAGRVGAHAEPHAELEQAREGAGRGQADHQTLQNAELRIGLHDAHETQHRFRRHEAVGIERDRKFVLCAPALAEVADIAGLETGILLAAAIGDANAAAPRGCERSELLVFGGRHGGIAGVAQDVDMKAIGITRGRDAGEHRLEIADHAVRQFVADAEKQRGRGGDRLVALDARGRRVDRAERVARKAHDEEADDRVPEADHGPGQCHGKEKGKQQIEKAEAAGGQRLDCHPDQRRHRNNDKRSINDAALAYG